MRNAMFDNPDETEWDGKKSCYDRDDSYRREDWDDAEVPDIIESGD